MIDRKLSYKKLKDYLQDLADKHVLIKSFVGSSRQELSNKVNASKKLETPALVFFGYEGKLDGNKQRTNAERILSFAIVEQVTKKDDFVAQDLAINTGEQIGLSVLSRIYYDSTKPDTAWLYNNFLKDSVRFLEIRHNTTDNLFGMEFHFQLKNKEPLVIDVNDWSDIDEVC